MRFERERTESLRRVLRVTFLVLTRGRELFQANPATLFRIGQCGM
jgi:hypothetical protein